MKKINTKIIAQSSLEYILTYGLALLIIAIVLLTFYGLEIFNSGGSTIQGCVAQTGFLCKSVLLITNGTYYATIGTLSTKITITGTACSDSAIAPPLNNFTSTNIALIAGQKQEVSFQCHLGSNTIGQSFKGTVWIEYEEGSNTELVSEVGSVSEDSQTLGQIQSTTQTTSITSTSVISTTITINGQTTSAESSSSSTTTSNPSSSSPTSLASSSSSTTISSTSTSISTVISVSTVLSISSSTTSTTTSSTSSTTIVSFNQNSYYNYSNVLLICNPGSTISLDVCTYFSNARIGEGFNITHILNLSSIPVSESVSDAYTQNILEQIKTKINNIGFGKIEYIVTTYGVPLIDTQNSMSIDSLIANNLTDGGYLVNNPYYKYFQSFNQGYLENNTFSYAEYHMYEVTRLDGPTLQSIYNLINDATDANVVSSKGYILLNSYSTSSNYQPFLSLFSNPSETLNSLNINNKLVNTSFLINTKNLSGYASWGSNCGCTLGTNSSKWNFTFNSGAIGETFVSTGSRTLHQYPWTGGQSLISDLIMENITGISGYVSEPYLSAVENLDGLFPSYFEGFTLADAYYSSMPFLNWKSVIIGDPKAHVKNI